MMMMTINWVAGSFWRWLKCLCIDCGDVPRMCTYLQTHQVVSVKYVQFLSVIHIAILKSQESGETEYTNAFPGEIGLVSGSCVHWPGMEAAVGKPVSVAAPCEKHMVFGEPHQFPDVVLTTGDQDVFSGVHGNAIQGERRENYREIAANGFTL